MRKPFVLAVATLAVVPALAFAQARPAQRPPAQQPRPAARPAQRPAAAPARAAVPAASAHRDGTWELSAGVGVGGAAKAYNGTASNVIGPAGFLRVGYNINTQWNVSVGSGALFGKSAATNLTAYMTPFAAVSWTPDINRPVSPFVSLGGGLLMRKNPSHTGAGALVGVGVRNMIGENLALRVEGNVMVGKFYGLSTGTGMATVGLSYFVGGKKIVTHIAVAPATASLASAGATQRLNATVHDQRGDEMTGKVVTWSSSNPQVATVNSQGTVTAVNDGSAEITATVEGVRGSARVTVARVVNSVTVSPTTGAINALGRTQQFTAAGKDAGNQPVANAQFMWSSSNSSVATVSPTGMVTALGTGTAQITATANGKSASASVTVTQAVASVSVTPASASISAGSTTQLAASAADANSRPVTGRTFTWMSESPSIATVSTTGLVTGLAAGTARITATAEGQSGAATITVTAVAAPPRVGEGVWPELQSAGGSRIVTGLNFIGRTARLSRTATPALNGLASMIKEVLRTDANAKFEISGYTDNTGVAAANRRISTARARAVVAFLTRNGVPASALTAAGFGSADPKWPNTTAANRRLNNRIEIKRTH